MGFKKFSWLIALRTSLILLTLLVIVQLIMTPGYHAATTLLVIILAIQFFDVIRYVSKTNSELVRFFDAARYADFSQRFELQKIGSGFDELGQAFSEILTRIQQVRAGQEQELKHLKAMVEHVPVPLLSLHNDDSVTLWNNSARRLFGTHQVTQKQDFGQFSHEFVEQINNLEPGQKKLIDIEIDGMQHQLALAATQLTMGGKRELLVSMQDIQSELDIAQLSAWQDLVRVLTHEIMNSITPVASLAKTTVDLVDDVKTQVAEPEILEELNDVSDAVSTVARRSDSLMHFVSSYRQLTRLPEPNKQKIELREFLLQVCQLATSQWHDKQIKLDLNVEPKSLMLNADKSMLEQLLINLLLNAEQAMLGNQQTHQQVQLNAYLNKRGRLVIDVADNGPGISDDIKDKVFVPFYTTKREGSGVGLALTRQIMITHHGTVKLDQAKIGGTLISLTF